MKDKLSLKKYSSTLEFLLERNDYQIIVNDDDSSEIYFYRRSIDGTEYILREQDISDFYSDRKKYQSYLDLSPDNKVYFGMNVIRTNRIVFEPRNEVIFDASSKSLNVCHQYARGIDRVDCGEPEAFLKFLLRLIPDESQRNLTLNWLACSFEQKLETYLFLVSPVEGIGKTMFFDKIIRNIVGSSLTTQISTKTFDTDFNSMCKNKLYILLDELTIKNPRSLSYFKSLVNHSREVVGKGRDAEEIDVYDNIVITSNNIHPYMLEDNSRRVFMPDLTKEKLTPDEIEYFVKKLSDEKSKIYNFLKNYKKDFSKSKKFLGPAHQEDRENHMESWVCQLEHWMKGMNNIKVTNVTLVDIKKEYHNFPFNSAKTLYRKLNETKVKPFEISFHSNKNELTLSMKVPNELSTIKV